MPASNSQASAEEVRTAGQGRAFLFCQVGLLVCALPLEHVSETMRPLPLEPLAGMAAFVAGVSIIRGSPVPVVDLARLLGTGTDQAPTRLVLVKVGERRVALSAGRVIGVRALDPSALGELPPVLGRASAEVISAVGALDARLLLVLETSRMLPDSSWASLDARGAPT